MSGVEMPAAQPSGYRSGGLCSAILDAPSPTLSVYQKAVARQKELAEAAREDGRQMWEVVGVADTGGILVRSGVAIRLSEVRGRLAFGARVWEVEIRGNRLQYKKAAGEGPTGGWVSLVFEGRTLLKKVTLGAALGV